MDRTKRLLAKGYFPSQLPPCFTTKDLGNHYQNLYDEWLKIQPEPKQGAKTPKAPSSKPELFSVARVGHKRRVMSLTNPIAQTFLAKHISENWGAIVNHYRQSPLSSSHPRFLPKGERAITIPSMQLLYERKVLRAAGYRYMLRTDISRFFPTIYTHSVPWAVHGKAISKRNRKYIPRYFGNILDLSLRQCQEEQTFGLPIGPDTSHIIAELIATSVDLEMKKRLKYMPAGFRYVDDYFMFFASAAEADAALAALIRALKDFELQINFEKTITCAVIEISDDYWTHQLRSFEIAQGGRKQASDIHHFFELSKELAKRNSDESVMAYALKKASSVLIKKENWKHFEAHLCQVALAFPNTLQIVARIFSTYLGAGYKLSLKTIARMLNSVIEDHSQLGHHSEVIWALWMLKELDIPISDSNIERISDMHSSVCALVLLDLHQKGKLGKAPKMTYWKHAESKEALYGDLWLLSYEAGVRSWGGFKNTHVLAHDYFSLLQARSIRFYDDSAKLPPIFHVKKEVLAERNLEDENKIYDLDDVDDLIEFDDYEDGYGAGIFMDDDFEDLDIEKENLQSLMTLDNDDDDDDDDEIPFD
jgi:hypothetical protein